MTDEPESKAVELISIAEASCSFFTDQHGTPYAFRNNPGHVSALKSREFKVWLVGEFYKRHEEAVGSDAISAAVNVLEAKANESARVTLSTRCGMDGPRRLLIDLASKDEQTVVIDAGGLRIESLAEPKFRRYSHMVPMEVAADAADLKEYAKFWRFKDPADDVLLVGFIGHAFVSEIPHAILVLIGSKGSTKTTATRATRQIIDPSSVADLTIGEKGKEFVQQLAHNYVPLFDNVSKLQPWQADDLCRASTGAGFSKRELYSDEDDVIFMFKRVVIVNGINTPTQRPDFLDRSILIECARVPRGERLEDSQVQAKISEWIPRLRRSIFEALATATQLIDQVRGELKELPRMADFAIWGEAFCRASGYAPLEFYNRLMEKVDETSTIALENDVIAELLFKLFDDPKSLTYGSKEFECTSSELLKTLVALNEELKYVGPKELPSSPDSLGRRLGELAADLEEVGIRIRRNRSRRKRSYIISRVSPRGSEEASHVSLVSPTVGPNGGQNDTSVTRDASKQTPIETPVTHDASDTCSLPLGGQGLAAKSKASIPHFFCSVCGKEIGTGLELSIYKIGKERFCKACYLEKKGEASA